MSALAFTKKKSAFGRLVGIETVKGGRSFRLKVTARHTNVMGHAHGGAIFTLADRTFACAVNRKGKSVVAMEMKINYLAPVKEGDILEARAKIIREGRTITVCCVEVWRKKELVAIMLATGFRVSEGK